MKFLKKFRAALAALALLVTPPALAQTVVPVPTNAISGAILDLGNGPTEVRMLGGNMGLFTSQSSGSGSTSGSSTTLTLVSTPLTIPCVGCIVSGTGITSGTTVAAFSGKVITLSTPMTVASPTTVSWGAACPSPPPQVGIALIQAAVGSDLPMYTQSRVCAYGGTGPGATFTQFAIGAH